MSLLRATAAVNGVEVIGVAGNCSFVADDENLSTYLYRYLLSRSIGIGDSESVSGNIFTPSDVSLNNNVISFSFRSVDGATIENYDVKGLILAHLNAAADDQGKLKGGVKKHLSDLSIDNVVFRMKINMVGTPRAVDYDTNSLQDLLGKYQRVNATNIDIEEISEDHKAVTVDVSNAYTVKDAKASVLSFLSDAQRNRTDGTERMRFSPSFETEMRTFKDTSKKRGSSMGWKDTIDSFTRSISKEGKRANSLLAGIKDEASVGDRVTELYRKLANLTYLYQLGISYEKHMVNEMYNNVLFGDIELLPDPEAAKKLRAYYALYEEKVSEAEKALQNDHSTNKGKNSLMLREMKRTFDAVKLYVKNKAQEMYDPIIPRESYLSAKMERAIENDTKLKAYHDEHANDPVPNAPSVTPELLEKIRSSYEKELASHLRKHQLDIDSITEEHAATNPDDKDFDPKTDPRHPVHQVYEGEYKQFFNTLVHNSSLKSKYPNGGLTWKDINDILSLQEEKLTADKEQADAANKAESDKLVEMHKETPFDGDARLLKAVVSSNRTDEKTKTSYLSPQVREAVLAIVNENAGFQTAQKLNEDFDSVITTADKVLHNFTRNKADNVKLYEDIDSFESQIVNTMQGQLPPVIKNFLSSHTKSVSEMMQAKQQWINAIWDHRNELYNKYSDKQTDDYGRPEIPLKNKSKFKIPGTDAEATISDKLFMTNADQWVSTLTKSLENDALALQNKDRKRGPGLHGGRSKGVGDRDPETTKEAANKSHIEAVTKFVNKYENMKGPLVEEKQSAFEDEYLDLYKDHITVLNAVGLKPELVNSAADLYDRLMGNVAQEVNEPVQVEDTSSESEPTSEPLDKGVAQEAINSTQTPAEGQD